MIVNRSSSAVVPSLGFLQVRLLLDEDYRTVIVKSLASLRLFLYKASFVLKGFGSIMLKILITFVMHFLDYNYSLRL